MLLASGGGALWTIGLVVTANDSLPLIGMFVMIAGGAAVLVGDRFAEDDPRLAAVARFAPMGIALLQLAMLLPRLEFSFIGWGSMLPCPPPQSVWLGATTGICPIYSARFCSA
ncbi:MAG: hypothetical protein IPP23_06195 [Sphingomonadales bacterium]|nr:hypothetical protein [Sphingomonadales bacterium]